MNKGRILVQFSLKWSLIEFEREAATRPLLINQGLA